MMKAFNILLLFSQFAFSAPESAKRAGPLNIKPIPFNQGTIHHQFVKNPEGFEFFVFMKDQTGDVSWKTRIYSRVYDKQMETDVQEIHLKTLYIEKSNIIVVDEWGQTYEIDLLSGKLMKPSKPVEY